MDDLDFDQRGSSVVENSILNDVNFPKIDLKSFFKFYVKGSYRGGHLLVICWVVGFILIIFLVVNGIILIIGWRSEILQLFAPLKMNQNYHWVGSVLIDPSRSDFCSTGRSV